LFFKSVFVALSKKVSGNLLDLSTGTPLVLREICFSFFDFLLKKLNILQLLSALLSRVGYIYSLSPENHTWSIEYCFSIAHIKGKAQEFFL
jgi:hypothetical protein